MSAIHSSKIRRLQAYRGQLGYSQQKLADVLGCSERAVQRLEAGGLPDLATALKLELLYCVPLQRLFAVAYDQLRQDFQPPPRPDPNTDDRGASSQGPRILAVDPSYKALGVALLKGQMLRYSDVRYLPQQPLPDRLLRHGVHVIEDLVRRCRPQMIVVPLTSYSGCTRSAHVRRFCWRLRKLAHRHGLRFAECGPNQVRAALGDRTTHYDRAQLIIERYPALQPKLPARRRAWDGPNARMLEFSAIGLALAAKMRRTRSADLSRERHSRSLNSLAGRDVQQRCPRE